MTNYWGQTVYDEPAKIEGDRATISFTITQPGWYKLRLNVNATSTSCAFGVVLAKDKERRFGEGKICADAAAWHVDPSKCEEFADIVKIIGLPMVRERIWWNDVEPSSGVYQWGRYETLINAYAVRGIAVDAIWHDTPLWARARAGSGTNLPPKLDAIRGFCLEAAKHFRGQVTA